MKLRLTDSIVGRLQPPSRGLRIARDIGLRGFGCRVLESGSRSFVLDFAAQTGKRHIYTVAPFTGYGGDETGKARREALLLQARIRGSEGHNPADAKRALRAVAAEAWTVAKLCDEYEREAERRIKRGELRKRTRNQYLAYTALLRAKFGTRLVANISKDDLQQWHAELSDERGRVQANACISLTRAVFSFAIEKEKVPSNPATGVKGNKTLSRARVLDRRERKAVWDAAEDLGNSHHRDMARLLLLLGQRRGEVAGMRWAELDLDNAMWNLPASRCKNGIAHSVPLPPMALKVLRDVPRKGDTVFSISNFGHAKKRLDKLSGVTGWCWHDLRRTCSTGMAEMNVAQEITEAILNHTSGRQSGVAAIYNRHDYAKEARAALTAWEKYLLQGEEPTIVQLNSWRATGK